jgi:hypothetical protein
MHSDVFFMHQQTENLAGDPGEVFFLSRPPQNGNLLRQRKNPDRLCMWNTLRALDFLASLHLTIFERPA